MNSFSSAVLDRISERPPTPPKDHSNEVTEAIEFLNVDYSLDQLPVSSEEQSKGVETPPRSSPPASQNDTGHRTGKKVEFCPWTVKHEGSSPLNRSAQKPTLRRLPSQRDLKPLKSILKTNLPQTPTTDESGSPGADYFASDEPKTFPKMLDSVLKSLGSQVPSVRVDAYQALNGALKTYGDLPNEEALRSKVPQLAQAITRDLSSNEEETHTTNIITQALKLVIAFLHIPSVASALSNEFQNSLLDSALHVLSVDPVNKAVANHYMYLLASQKFNQRILTTAKADQIITRLNNIHDRVSGNSVVAARLVIYQRLLEQLPTLMLTKIRDWLPHTFHGVLSSNKDIRQRAIEFGTLAGLALGTHSSASKAINDLCKTDVRDGGDYGTYLLARLNDMLSEKEKAYTTAQIWGMMVLFFRNKKKPITQWPMLRPMLKVIQRCLNTSDLQTKTEATTAWNRLVFVIDLASPTLPITDRIVGMLKVPFDVVLDKRVSDVPSGEARRLAKAGYCNLLYYALQPEQSFARLDVFWDEYVDAVLTKAMRVDGTGPRFAGRILRSLFQGGCTVWTPDRANEPRKTGPEDLPRLDPRWVRSRLPKILKVMEPYLVKSMRQPGELHNIQASPWPCLVAAVADAGRNEVRISVELKEALAHIVNFYSRLWTGMSEGSEESEHGLWISRFGDLVTTTVQALGSLVFAEENLVCTMANTVEPAPTPSSRASKHHVSLQSPLAHIWALFGRLSLTIIANEAYFDVARDVLRNVLTSQSSGRSKFMLLRQCLASMKVDSEARLTTIADGRLWDILAGAAVDVLLEDNEAVQDKAWFGQTVRMASSLLVGGMKVQCRMSSPSPAFVDFFSALRAKLKSDTGVGGPVVGLLEPLAEVLLGAQIEASVTFYTELATLVLDQCVWLRTRQQLEDAQKVLHGSHLDVTRKHTVFEPYNHVLGLANSASSMIYSNATPARRNIVPYLKSVQDFIVACPPSYAPTLLRKLQSGFGLLIEDEGQKFKSMADVSSELLKLWNIILVTMKAMPTSSLLLKALTQLVRAGFHSTQRNVVNATITAWNQSFGQINDLSYPAGLLPVLHKLKDIVEIDLPNFPQDVDFSDIDTKLPFIDSQVDIPEAEAVATETLKPQHTPAKAVQYPKSFSELKTVVVDANGLKESPNVGTPSRTKAKIPNASAKSRLRHEDSQINFVPVESSPLVAQADESQNLTEHQKEVIQRQRSENAHLYLNMSSSPAPPSADRPRPQISKLDFSSSGSRRNARFATPEPVHEHGPMDVFLGSSPTPRSSQRQNGSAEMLCSAADPEADHADQDEMDIPSSPPEAAIDLDGTHKLNDIEKEEAPLGPKQAVLRQRDDKPTTTDASPQAHEKPVIGNVPQTNVESDVQPKMKLPSVNVGAHTSPEVAQSSKFAEQANEINVIQESQVVAGEELVAPVAHDTNEVDEFADAASELPEEDEANHESDEDPEQDSSPIDFPESLPEGPAHQATAAEDLPGRDDQEPVDDATTSVADREVIRVEDSFVGFSEEDKTSQKADPEKQLATSVEPEQADDTIVSSATPVTRSKKRKATTPSTANKRRKRSSPIKRLLPRWLGGSQDVDDKENVQEEEEEYMEDCIVVASQPERMTTPNIAPSQKEEERPVSQPILSAASKRRGRGRPRKSTTPCEGSPASSTRAQRLKRRSSAMSITTSDDLPDDSVDASRIIETPAPNKARKLHNASDAKVAQRVQQKKQEQEGEDEPLMTNRLDAVVVPATDINRDEYDTFASDSEAFSPEKQLRQETQAAAFSQTRSIAKPKSIMDKLRGVWQDLQNAMLGANEEREITDMLFELRSETVAAARRGHELK